AQNKGPHKCGGVLRD
nr:EJa=low Mr zona pellucida binding protein {N-terminal} [swine, pH3 extract of ejaculated spermatozoa, Peptide Partial, 15 aa] [Sus scrofa]